MKQLLLLWIAIGLGQTAIGQKVRIDSSKYPPIVTFTAKEDHENMMKQLGIRKLRPGPSGNESAPNHANYDESVANPCPQLPDILTTWKGTQVTSADMWWKTTPT